MKAGPSGLTTTEICDGLIALTAPGTTWDEIGSPDQDLFLTRAHQVIVAYEGAKA